MMRYLLDRCIHTNERQLDERAWLEIDTPHPLHCCTWIVKTILFPSQRHPRSHPNACAHFANNARCKLLATFQFALQRIGSSS